MNGTIDLFSNRLAGLDREKLNIGVPTLKYTKHFISEWLADSVCFVEVKGGKRVGDK